MTVAIHYYEREEFKVCFDIMHFHDILNRGQRESFVDRITPEIVVEPQSTCSIMNFYTDKLAVIPFRGDPLAQITDKVDSEYSLVLLRFYLICS